MNRKLDYVSEQLRDMRRKLADHRHGGIVLESEQVEGFVQSLDQAIADAINLECALSNIEWNRRAAEDRHSIMTPSSVVVLDAFRKDPKIVQFPGRGPNHPGRA